MKHRYKDHEDHPEKSHLAKHVSDSGHIYDKDFETLWRSTELSHTQFTLKCSQLEINTSPLLNLFGSYIYCLFVMTVYSAF